MTGLQDFGEFLTDLTALDRRQAWNEGQTFALYYVSLEGFFLVDGRYDRNVGERVLSEMTQRLLAWLDGREGSVAPVGPDHFVVLCVGRWDDASVAAAVRELRDSLTRPVRGESLTICFSVSVGVALRDPKGRRHPGSYVRDASARKAKSSIPVVIPPGFAGGALS
jgi:predicted signal transduction protein with EAL and GGDEF domain